MACQECNMEGSGQIELSLDFDGYTTEISSSRGASPKLPDDHPNVRPPDANDNLYAAHDDEEANVREDCADEHHVHPIPDEQSKTSLTHRPGEHPQPQHQPKGAEDEETKEEASRPILVYCIESFKYLYSLGLLVFSVVIVMAAIFTKQTTGTDKFNVHPILAFIIFWFLICWLAMMEGGQGCLVGLKPIDKSLYTDSHFESFMSTDLAHRGDNMERFIVGRQFLAVLMVFAINLMASAVEDASVLSLSEGVTTVFLSSGVAVILITIMLGQLTGQVNAANCMLDFINNYFMLFTTYVSLVIEMSGLLHSVYLVQILFSKITGKPIESNEPLRGVVKNIFFWGRVLVSFFILSYSFAVTLRALFDGNTTMWEGIPSAVSVVIFFVLMCVVGMMEGMQIALFAVLNLPEEELQNHATAYKNYQLVLSGQNLQAFLIGRQIFVTICMFVVARITTLDIGADEDNIFGVSDGLQEFFNTGLLGAIITTIVASLIWRVVASSVPVAFLSNPLVYFIIRICLLLEKSGICSAAWVLARYHKVIANYQPDEVHLSGAEPHTDAPVTDRDKDIDRLVAVLKFTYSLALLFFAIVLVMAAVFTEQTSGTIDNKIHPILAFVIFWFLIIWLGMMEGGQGALVGLQPIDKEYYADSHSLAHKCTLLVHKADNMERFIVGRQFLAVLVVFVINLMASAAEDASVLGLPDLVNEIFLATGIAVILVTIIVGQLTAQVNAAKCMLDFINNYFMLFTTYVSLGIEISGLLHSVYLVQIFFSMFSDRPIHSDQPPRSCTQKFFFWARVLMSCAILGFAFAVTLAALFDGKTMMWEGVPSAASVVVLFFLMCFVGMMEGIQIALFAVVNLPEDEVANHPLAHKICKIAFSGTNLQAFLIGRQICVTICMFVVARITTLNVDVEAGEETVFGVSDGAQEFFNTGLLGALITTIVGSLAWRIVASSIPLAFLSNFVVYLILRLCLFLEASGVCSAAWLLARVHKRIVGYKPDEIYIGTAEERAAVTKVTTKMDASSDEEEGNVVDTTNCE